MKSRLMILFTIVLTAAFLTSSCVTSGYSSSKKKSVKTSLTKKSKKKRAKKRRYANEEPDDYSLGDISGPDELDEKYIRLGNKLRYSSALE